MPKFNFNSKVIEVKWLVEPLIPAGQLDVVLAQAGVGKSLVVEDLAVHIVHEVPFCGFNTKYSDVLIIDQDTPSNVLNMRLINFAKGLGNKEIKHELFVESMKGYSLADGTLTSVIKEHKTCNLIVIDSLHSVCGTLNPNYTSDMNRLAKLKAQCLNEDRTIIINHHISEKLDYTVEQLMTENSHTMAMGNSAIIQQADSYYIIGASAENGLTNKLFIRPIAKRVSIPSTPIVTQMIQLEQGERMEFHSNYEVNLNEVELDCLTLFKEQPSDRTVKETYDDMGQIHGIIAIRKALATLHQKGMLLMSRHKSNLFRYRLP